MKLARFEIDQEVFYGVVEGSSVKLLEGTYWDSLRGTEESVKLSEVISKESSIPSVSDLSLQL